jgi:hypothetical protein
MSHVALPDVDLVQREDSQDPEWSVHSNPSQFPRLVLIANYSV